MKKVALITGGSRGIGFGIAQQLAQHGFNLAINGVRPEAQAKEAIQELKKLGAEVYYCQGNVAVKEDRTKIIEDVKNHFKRLDVLVNNAGIAPRERADILNAKEEIFDEVINTNLKGTYFLTQAAANWMIEQKKNNPGLQSCIINITSMSSTVASVNRGEYCISKAGLSMASQLFAVRLGEFNIPVYEVRPGIIATDMTSGVKEKYDNLIEGGLTIEKRWGKPEDVGKIVNALAQGNLPYGTGQVIMVDGGLTTPRL
jgi:3-oxoacyl-[acyl-carrier protein] reductase